MNIICAEDIPPGAHDVAARKVAGQIGFGPLANLRWDMSSGATETPVLAFPHRVAWLRHRDLLPGAGTELRDCVEDRGWRFLVATRPAGTVHAAVQTWLAEGLWRVSSIRGGRPASEWMPKALDAACKHTAPDSEDHEPHYLWCSALRTTALWLRPYGPGSGKIVPMPDAWKTSTPFKVIGAEDYLRALRDLMEKRRGRA